MKRNLFIILAFLLSPLLLQGQTIIAGTFSESITIPVLNGGSEGTTDWINPTSGVAENWSASTFNATYSIITGEGFNGNAQKINGIDPSQCVLSSSNVSINNGGYYKLSYRYKSNSVNTAVFEVVIRSATTIYYQTPGIALNTGNAIDFLSTEFQINENNVYCEINMINAPGTKEFIIDEVELIDQDGGIVSLWTFNGSVVTFEVDTLNPAALDYIARLDSTPNELMKAVYSVIFDTLQSANLDDSLSALYFMQGNNYDDAKLNLLTDNYNLTDVGGCSFTQYEGIRTGSGKYLKTGINPYLESKSKRESSTIGFFCNDERLTGYDGFLMGCSEGSGNPRNYIRPKTVGNLNQAAINTTSAASLSAPPTIYGLKGYVRTGVNVNFYAEDSLSGTRSLLLTDEPNYEFYIGTLNLSGNPNSYDSLELSILFLGAAITESQFKSLSWCIDYYKSAVEFNQSEVVYDTQETILGIKGVSYDDNNFIYSSTIDTYTDLYAKYSYNTGFTGNLPIVLLGHGWSGDAETITEANMHAYADSGFFVLSVGMRGRNGASGARDASGLELYDIYDAVSYVKDNFSIVSDNKVAMSGYSGGGGNAEGITCKFPDLLNLAAIHYGMSDYGYTDSSWYYTNTPNQASIETAVGGSPASIPDNYMSRNARLASPYNFLGGDLLMYHSPTDASVSVIHSQLMDTAYQEALKDNYKIDINSIYTHSNFTYITIPEISDSIKSNLSWSIPESGYIYVIGYIKTKLFEITLGNGDNEVSEVYYNTKSGIYKIIPKTGDIIVSITQGGLSYNGTITTDTYISVH